MNPYKNYNFVYNEKNTYNNFKEQLKKNSINSLDSFVNFVNQCDDSFSYDTLYSYYTGKRALTFPIINLIHNALKISYQELIIPNSSCLYDDVINDDSLVFDQFNNYRNSYFDFALYENICFLYNEKYGEKLKLEDVSSKKLENLIINDITTFEKKLCRLIYLLQKNSQGVLSNYEKRELDSGLFYIYNFSINDEFLARTKEYTANEFYFNLYNEYSLSLFADDNPEFLTLFFYGNEYIVNKMQSFLNPIEKDILLTIIDNFKDSNSLKLKSSLINLGAAKLNLKFVNSNLEKLDYNNFNNILEKINEAKSYIKNLNFKKYQELKEVRHE